MRCPERPGAPPGLCVPRGRAKPPGWMLVFASLSFFGYKVEVRDTVWHRIGVGSVQSHFDRLSSSSSFVKFRRVSRRSSFRSSSFAPFGAYKTCLCHPSRGQLPCVGSSGVSRHCGWGAGAWDCWVISYRFVSWLKQRPSTRFGSLRSELVRIVLPLELEIYLLCKIGSLVVIALKWFAGYPLNHQGTDLALVCACCCLFVLVVVVWEHRE